jgi:hypothetical protein
MTRTDRIEALATVADAWVDAEHPPRAAAAEASLAADNRFTQGAIAYTLNHWMHAFTPDALDRWLPAESPERPQAVGVAHGAEVPADGLREAVAVLGSGHAYAGCIAEAAPALVPAFLEAVEDIWPGAPIRTVEAVAFPDGLNAVIAKQNPDNAKSLRARCDARDIPTSQRQIQPYHRSLSVLDGHESDDERESWAEDVLLYEGQGHSIAVVFAPKGLDADPYFDALAHFRGIVPSHDATPGALQMQQAFLEAQDAPHAHADDLSFLVSRGDPEAHPSTHLRWVPYTDVQAVAEWIETHAAEWHAVVARPALHDWGSVSLPVLDPGTVHRPPLDAPSAQRLARFLEGI